MYKIRFFITEPGDAAQTVGALIKNRYCVEVEGSVVDVIVSDIDTIDLGPGEFEIRKEKPKEAAPCFPRDRSYLWAVPVDDDPETMTSRANAVTKNIREMMEHGTPPTEEDLKRLLQFWGFGLGVWGAVFDVKRYDWDLRMQGEVKK